MKYGYARVSTDDQSTALQLAILRQPSQIVIRSFAFQLGRVYMVSLSIRRDLLENPRAESQNANSKDHKPNKSLAGHPVTHSLCGSCGRGSICPKTDASPAFQRWSTSDLGYSRPAVWFKSERIQKTALPFRMN